MPPSRICNRRKSVLQSTLPVYAPESIALLVQADSSSIPPFCTLEFPPLDVFFVRQLSLWKLVQTAAGWIRKKLDQDEERCELVEEDDGRVVCRCAFGTRMKCPVSFALHTTTARVPVTV